MATNKNQAIEQANVIEREINGTTYRATFENVDFGANLIALETKSGNFYYEEIYYLLESDLHYFWRTDFEKDFEGCLSKLLKIRDLREELEHILYSLRFD